jgi:hypothetical protein
MKMGNGKVGRIENQKSWVKEEGNFDKNSSDAGSSVISNDLKRRANDA